MKVPGHMLLQRVCVTCKETVLDFHGDNGKTALVFNGLGTPTFMSPEQLHANVGDVLPCPKAIDVWAFGVCMWMMASKCCRPSGISLAKLYGDRSQDSIKEHVRNGGVPNSPPKQSPLVHFINQCFMTDPFMRPSFQTLHDGIVTLKSPTSMLPPQHAISAGKKKKQRDGCFSTMLRSSSMSDIRRGSGRPKSLPPRTPRTSPYAIRSMPLDVICEHPMEVETPPPTPPMTPPMTPPTTRPRSKKTSLTTELIESYLRANNRPPTLSHSEHIVPPKHLTSSDPWIKHVTLADHGHIRVAHSIPSDRFHGVLHAAATMARRPTPMLEMKSNASVRSEKNADEVTDTHENAVTTKIDDVDTVDDDDDELVLLRTAPQDRRRSLVTKALRRLLPTSNIARLHSTGRRLAIRCIVGRWRDLEISQLRTAWDRWTERNDGDVDDGTAQTCRTKTTTEQRAVDDDEESHEDRHVVDRLRREQEMRETSDEDDDSYYYTRPAHPHRFHGPFRGDWIRLWCRRGVLPGWSNANAREARIRIGSRTDAPIVSLDEFRARDEGRTVTPQWNKTRRSVRTIREKELSTGNDVSTKRLVDDNEDVGAIVPWERRVATPTRGDTDLVRRRDVLGHRLTFTELIGLGRESTIKRRYGEYMSELALRRARQGRNVFKCDPRTRSRKSVRPDYGSFETELKKQLPAKMTRANDVSTKAYDDVHSPAVPPGLKIGHESEADEQRPRPRRRAYRPRVYVATSSSERHRDVPSSSPDRNDLLPPGLLRGVAHKYGQRKWVL